jgi:hypothetical protein
VLRDVFGLTVPDSPELEVALARLTASKAQ